MVRTCCSLISLAPQFQQSVAQQILIIIVHFLSSKSPASYRHCASCLKIGIVKNTHWDRIRAKLANIVMACNYVFFPSVMDL